MGFGFTDRDRQVDKKWKQVQPRPEGPPTAVRPAGAPAFPPWASPGKWPFSEKGASCSGPMWGAAAIVHAPDCAGRVLHLHPGKLADAPDYREEAEAQRGGVIRQRHTAAVTALAQAQTALPWESKCSHI